MSGSQWRYAAWDGGPDPLAAPFDLRRAVDALGDDILAGTPASQALRQLLRRGMDGLPGLAELRRRLRQRQEQIRQSGRLDGTLEQARQLLHEAIELERGQLFRDPDDAARLAEEELATLPDDPARAIRHLAEYRWRSAEAERRFDQIRDLLRRELLDSQFQGLKQAMTGADAEQLRQVTEMVADLNALLAAHARGVDTTELFEEFMRRHGEMFPEQPTTVAELIDSLARRAAAQQRLMQSLTPRQRQELTDLLASALAEAPELAAELARLHEQLRLARPDLRWGGMEPMRGEQPMGLGDATTAVAELAELAELAEALDQDYPGASLDDIDPELVRRLLGRQGVDDLAALRRIEAELARQGYLNRAGGRTQLTPKAIRRIGSTALRRVFARMTSDRGGDHDIPDAGPAGELTGGSRPWQFGDEQPLDVVRTVRNAVIRGAGSGTGTGTGGGRGRVALAVEDFEVAETERRSSAAVALLVDLSYSMALRGTWATAKTTALALHALVTTGYPQDSIQLIGFSNYARVLNPGEFAELSWDPVQGTNLQHALMLARRHLGRHPGAEPVIMVVTDGEPTAHLAASGEAEFAWPPLPETLARTMAEVERCTRAGATINVFMLDTDPALVRFVERLAQHNGGRVFHPEPERLGEYVVRDYLRARRGRRGR